MYGSIFSMQVKSGHEDQLLSLFNSYNESKPDGGVAWFVLNADEKDEWIGVAVFTSKEAYVTNANRPEQHDNFVQMMKHLESEPQWTDGKYMISKTY